jgi:hypothetical protein
MNCKASHGPRYAPIPFWRTAPLRLDSHGSALSLPTSYGILEDQDRAKEVEEHRQLLKSLLDVIQQHADVHLGKSKKGLQELPSQERKVLASSKEAVSRKVRRHCLQGV